MARQALSRDLDASDVALGRITFGIGAIVRNECPYIVEWLSHHRALGVDQFFIADDNSDDGTTDLLHALADAGLIHLVPIRRSQGPRQLMVYEEIMKRHRGDVDWMAFIDVDEFLVPTSGTSLRQALAPLLVDGSIGAIAVNWCTFGSSGYTHARSGLVTERFTRRGPREWETNRHIKTIVRSDAFAATGPNPHVVLLRFGYNYLHADRTSVAQYEGRAGLSQHIVWEPLRINHYVIKSEGEFVKKKMLRGDPMNPRHRKDMRYFKVHDRNEEDDPVAKKLVTRTREEMARIEEILHRRNTASARCLAIEDSSSAQF